MIIGKENTVLVLGII